MLIVEELVKGDIQTSSLIIGLKDQGIIKRNPEEISLENLHEEYLKKNKDNLEEYENLRIPKPWDEQEEQIDVMRKQNRKIKGVRELKRELLAKGNEKLQKQ